MPPADGQGTTVPLSLFAGLNTELSVPDLPEGISPDNQDVVYLPGSVQSRPGLRKVLSAALPNSPTMVYQKTYVSPTENPLNLYLDSNGVLWQEDVNASPGAVSMVETIPDVILQAQSVSAFGREYIAASNGVHGAHVPLQYDGQFLDRVSQDGPGAPPVVGGENIVLNIVAAPNGLFQAVGNILAAPNGLVEVGNVVTVTCSNFAFDGIVVGDQITIAGAGVAAYNGTWTVSALVGPNFGFAVQFVHPTAGLAASGGGATGDFIADVTVTTPTSVAIGQPVTIAGAGVGGYNGTWVVRYITSGFNFGVAIASTGLVASGNGTVTLGGNISAGLHKCVVLFQTRQGYVTAPSPPTSWTAAGGKRVVVGNIPIGPSNVITRILAFTGAGGANYFYIPETIQVPGTLTIVSSTVIADNTTTQVTIDFNDNSLFAATAIDIQGRNYFAQQVLADATTVFAYASRMFWGGERNNLKNFLNMGLEGGYVSLTNPLGWVVVPGTGGTLVNGGAWSSGMAWQVTGDPNPVVLRGFLIQGAYQDINGIAILQPSSSYTFRCWAKVSVLQAGGNLTITIDRRSGGTLAMANIPLASITIEGGFVEAFFTSATPSTIPTDAEISIFENGLGNGQLLEIDELELIPTQQPFHDNLWRVSYVNGPEQFDGVTGVLGSTSDPSPIRRAYQLRNVMYYRTLDGLHSTMDTGTSEPSSWPVPEVSQSVGAISIHGTDPGPVGTGESGEQWEFTASRDGLYVFAGGDDLKVSQEIQTLWDAITPGFEHTVWVKNDRLTRRCYIGIPTGGASAPNQILVLDYRELNTASAIANSPPIHISLSGKMIASDLSRKWTKWSLPMNCAEILSVSNGERAFVLGCGNGQTPGAAAGFGESYSLDATKLTDDDYGQITPLYTTYFFVSDEQEQALGLDSHRKLASYLAMFITGTGQTSITPLANVLANAFPSLPNYPLSTSQDHDLEWGMNVTGECIALRIGSIPTTGTDNGFNLQKLAMTLKKEPVAPLRGAM